MAWETELVEILRVLIQDMDESPKYDDTKLSRIIVVGAQLVINELVFSQDFEAQIGALDISPDPTDDATRDDSFINLVCIKAACIMNRGEAFKESSNAIKMKDGFFTSLDLTGVPAAKLAILKEGWCKVYEEEKQDYQMNSNYVAGAAIMTPFRTLAGYLGYNE